MQEMMWLRRAATSSPAYSLIFAVIWLLWLCV